MQIYTKPVEKPRRTACKPPKIDFRKAVDMIKEIIKPAPDSQYRLLPCTCGGTPVYRHMEYDFTNVDFWRVACPACGRQTTDFHVRHEAQLDWNTDMKREGVKLC